MMTAKYTKLLKTSAKLALSVSFLTALTACQPSTSADKSAKVDHTAAKTAAFPSVLQLFSCKTADKAFIAAHRGTHEGSDFPENALESLQDLYAKGLFFAEIDVAGLKDGTHILFHDGTWERSSTGSGPIAASNWSAAQKLLLKDTNGGLTAYRPSAFDDVLSWAKDKMYLEIDFKSSANEVKLVEAVRAAEMLDQVILISYSTEQAVRLHKLAPKAALSVGVFTPGDIEDLQAAGVPTEVMTAWTGTGPLTVELAATLRQRGIPILAPSFYDLDDVLQESKEFSRYAEFAKLPDLIVSDFALNAQQAVEIKGDSLEEMNACLAGIGVEL